jgi:hypothetical protein
VLTKSITAAAIFTVADLTSQVELGCCITAASKDLSLGSAIYSFVIKAKYCYGLGSCNLLYA